MAKEQRRRQRRLTYYPTTTTTTTTTRMTMHSLWRREVLSLRGTILLPRCTICLFLLMLILCCFLFDVCSPFGGIHDIVTARHRQPRRIISIIGDVVSVSSGVRNNPRRLASSLWGLSPSQEVLGDAVEDSTGAEENQAPSSSSSLSTGTQIAEDVKDSNSHSSSSSLLKNSYRVVSDQDPEWYENFVVNILGDDAEEVVLLAAPDNNNKMSTPNRNGKNIGSGNNSVQLSTTTEETTSTGTTNSDIEALLREIEEEARKYAAGGGEDTREDTKPQQMNVIAGESIASSLAEIKGSSVDKESTTKEENSGFSALRQEENATANSTTTKGYEQVSSRNTTTTSITNATTIATAAAAAAPVEDDANATSSVNQTTSATVDEDEMVVLFREAFQESWTRVPLAKLEALGYSNDDVYRSSGGGNDDISSLHPDALSLIVSDNIRRPRSGIPSRWKLVRSGRSKDKEQPSAAIVKLLSTSDADRFLKEIEDMKLTPSSNKGNQEKVERTKKSMRDPDEERELPPNRGRPLPTRRRKQKRASDEGQLEEPAGDRQFPRRRRRDDGARRTKYRDDGRLKPVYTGRQNSAIKRRVEMGDPPPPKSGLWPDIDTFRNLLRNEAGMRLSILGDDWTDIVKQESDWRLDLYKSWLWTLHNGVGEPIVQSRSDRARRKRIGGGASGSAGLETASRPSRRRRDERERLGVSSSSSGNRRRERNEPRRQRRRRGD